MKMGAASALAKHAEQTERAAIDGVRGQEQCQRPFRDREGKAAAEAEEKRRRSSKKREEGREV